MNKEDYQEIFMQSSAYKVAVDPNFTVLNASDGFLKATHNKRDDIIGKYIFDVFPKLSKHIGVILINTMRDSFHKVLKDKVTHTSPVVRYQNSDDDDDVRYWKVVNTPILDEDGEVRFISQRFVDVTDSRKLTDQLEVEKQNLDEYKTAAEYIENVFKQAPAPICILRGPEHIFELTNKEFLRIVPNQNIHGKPIREAMPELEGQGFFEILDEVYATENSYVGSEFPATFKMGRGIDVDVYIDFVYQILYDTNGEKSGIFVMGIDVTDQVLARKKAEESEYRYRTLIEESTVGTAIFRGPDIIVEYANDKMLDYWNKTKSVFGKPFRKVLPELEKQLFFDRLDHVYKTGEAYTGIEEKAEVIVDGELKTFFYNYSFKALRNINGDIYGIHNVAVDVTEQVLARKKAEESEYRYRKLIEESMVAMALSQGPDIILQYANDKMLDIWGKDKSIIGQPIRKVLPELEGQPFFDLVEKVYETGETYIGTEEKAILLVDGKPQTFFFNYHFKALRDKEGEIYGIHHMAIDVTEQVLARKKAEESEYRYRKLIEESPVATSLYVGPDFILQYANDNMLDFWDKDKTVFGQSLRDVLPELENQPFFDYLNKVYETGETYTGKEEKAVLKKGGKLKSYFFNFTYKALLNSDGDIYGVLNIAIDVTEQVKAKKALEENREFLNQLLNSMPQKISHTDEEGNVVFFNQQWIDETGLSLEELRNNGWIRTIHPDDIKAVRKEWEHAVQTSSVFEVESRIIHKDLGYRWNLNRAVPVFNDQGDLLMWVGSNTDIHEQKRHEETLEKAVRERTQELEKANEELILQNQEKEKRKKELEIANKELESFAYISSHDLQEPLRKIQIFIGRIIEKEILDERIEYYFDRIRDAADRMRILIEDLLYFSRVNNTEKIFEVVDLNNVIEEVKQDFKEEIREKSAIVDVGEICEVNVILFQFRQLMKNLLSNALKFSRRGIPPLITINSVIEKGSKFNVENLDPEKEYCHIYFKDNGIGFEGEYNERIFEVFQRLHSKEVFTGTGIGLAIVKKIVDNHNGIITAKGIPNEGAQFDIYLPVKQENGE